VRRFSVLFALVVIGLLVVALLVSALPAPVSVTLGVVVIGAFAAIRYRRRKGAADAARVEWEAAQARLRALTAKFGAEGASNIVNRRLWLGAPVDAVIEMFGHPADTKRAVTTTKVRLNLRYFPVAANRYQLKIDVENDIVTGWED
jgi:hypothetical protein